MWCVDPGLVSKSAVFVWLVVKGGGCLGALISSALSSSVSRGLWWFSPEIQKRTHRCLSFWLIHHLTADSLSFWLGHTVWTSSCLFEPMLHYHSVWQMLWLFHQCFGSGSLSGLKISLPDCRSSSRLLLLPFFPRHPTQTQQPSLRSSYSFFLSHWDISSIPVVPSVLSVCAALDFVDFWC